VTKQCRFGAIENFVRRWFVACDGTSVVEYSVVLAMIVGGTLALLGSASFTMQHIETALVSGSGAPHASSVASPDKKNMATSEAAPTQRMASYGMLGIGIGLVFITVAGGGYVIWRRRPQEIEELADGEETESMSRCERRSLFKKRQQILRVLSHNQYELTQNRICVRHLMSRDLLTIPPSMPVEEIGSLMKENEIRHLLVTGKKGQLLGIISDRDIRNRTGSLASEIMTRQPETTTPSSPVGQIITLMMHQHISCVPVIDSGVLCGILTSTDMMMSLHCTLQILMKSAAKLNDESEVPAEPVTVS